MFKLLIATLSCCAALASGPAQALVSTDSGVESVIRILKGLAPKAEKAGVVMALESYLSADDNLKIIARVGPCTLAPKLTRDHYVRLVQAILSQQVSTKAAQSVWHKLEGIVGDLTDPGNITRATDEQLREAGLSRQKAGYARSLAGLVTARGQRSLASHS